jgi:MFS family permease
MMTCVGMVVTGYAADRFGNLITATTSYAVTALGVFCLMMVQFWPSWVMVGGYILAVGGTLGVRSPMIQAIASRRFAGPGFGVIFGAVSIGQGLGAGGGALIAGYLHDLTGSYTANFLWSFVSVAAAVMVFWMFPELQDNPADRRRRAKSQRRLPEEKNND